MISVSIDVTGLQEAIGKLDKLKQVVTDFTPESQKIGDWLMGFLSNDVFDTEGAIYGSMWAPLSSQYASYKARKYGAQKILVATGKMRQGYKLYTATDMLTVKNEATNAQGDFYAGYHQQDNGGGGKMPRRILIQMDDDRTQKIVEILVKSLNDRIIGL